MIELKPTKVETTYRHKKTGELFKERKDWEAKGYKKEDMAQDVNVVMPSLDLFGKTKQNSTMAITRTQIAKQLLANGGRTGFFTAGLAAGDDISPGTSTSREKGIMSRGEGPKGTTGDIRDFKETGPERFSTYSAEEDDLLPGDVLDETVDLPENDPRRIRKEFITKPSDYPKYTPPYIKAAGDFNRAPNRKFFYEKVLKNNAPGYTPQQLEEEYEKYMSKRMSGETDAYGNVIPKFERDGPPQEELFPLVPEDKVEDPTENPFIPNFRLMADGGRAEFAEGGMPYEGGIMDLETSRQMYGLGKLVKKVTRGVKKIVKSPIGKAALLGAIGFGIPGVTKGFFQKGLMGTKFGMSLPGMFQDFKAFGNVDKALDIGSKAFKLGDFFSNPLVSIGLPTIASYLMTPKEEDQKELSRGADIDDPNTIMANVRDYQNIRLMADGGIMRAGYQEGSKEPVAKKTMPLLDMDGKEKDYRETGGFVDMGRMERADDVPARLSKNEFVFTADAVRNAGDGSVDKGAEVMYNMMKNLESGGEVSEESQGLEGARKMFQTSQRLEEVI